MAKIWHVTVRDVWCGVPGKYAEEAEVTTKEEADAWAKEWRQEYPKDGGFKVTVREIEA